MSEIKNLVSLCTRIKTKRSISNQLFWLKSNLFAPLWIIFFNKFSKSIMSSTINSTSQPGAATSQVVARCRFCIPKPRSLAKFIIFPSLWRLPNINNPSALFHRIKNNLLYFQTNYLIISLVFFAIFT